MLFLSSGLVRLQARWRPTVEPSLGMGISMVEEVAQPCWLVVVDSWDTFTMSMTDLPVWSLTSHTTLEGGLLSSPEQV